MIDLQGESCVFLPVVLTVSITYRMLFPAISDTDRITSK